MMKRFFNILPRCLAETIGRNPFIGWGILVVVMNDFLAVTKYGAGCSGVFLK